MADYPMPGNVEFNAAQEQQQRSNQAIQNSMIASMTKSPSAPAAAAATPAAKDSSPPAGASAGAQFLSGMQKPSDVGSRVAGMIGNAGSGGGGGTTMGSNNAIDPSTVDASGSLPALY